MKNKPLCIDLCCGIGGWAEGFLAAGYDVIGFDIRTFKKHPYPGQLVLQDIRTLEGRQFRKAKCIVASPPCEHFSKYGMPASWHPNRSPDKGIELFRTCERIGKEAEVPIVIENVRTAQQFIGNAEVHFGSYYLWGDVPLLTPRMRFVKGSFCRDRARTFGNSSWGMQWRHSSEIAAKIPFDLAYWLAISL